MSDKEMWMLQLNALEKSLEALPPGIDAMSPLHTVQLGMANEIAALKDRIAKCDPPGMRLSNAQQKLLESEELLTKATQVALEAKAEMDRLQTVVVHLKDEVGSRR